MTQNKKYQKDLPTLRQSLTSIDEQIVKHLIQRLKISEQIAAVKMDLDLVTEDKEREKEVIAAAVNAAVELTNSAIHIQAIIELKIGRAHV